MSSFLKAHQSQWECHRENVHNVSDILQSKMKNDLITVFIPVYNGEKFLRSSWDSLRVQTFSRFRVLYVDDSSTDNSWDILQALAVEDSRIQVYRKKNQGSVPFSWNYVFPKIETEFTLYMSQDDLLENDCLEKLVQRQEETQADAVVCTVEFFHERKKSQTRVDSGLNGDCSRIISGREAYQLSLDYTIPGFCLWNTKIIRDVGVLTDAFNSDEYAQRIWFLNSPRVAFSDARFYYRQDNPLAITKTFSFNKYSSILTNIHLYDSMISEDIPRDFCERMKAKYFGGVLYLSAVYTLLHRQYTAKQRGEIEEILQRGHCKFMRLKRSYAKGYMTWLASCNTCLYRVIAYGFAWKLRFRECISK